MRKAALWVLACASPWVAQAAAFNLSGYGSAGIYHLDDVLASEASAVTYNWDTGSLYVIGDEGDYLVEVDGMGNTLSSMPLSGFEDPEGLTYIGSGRVLIAEERIQDLFELEYDAGASVSRASLTRWDIGPDVGNIGLEGVSYDPATGRIVGVKEKSPQAVYDITLGPSPNAVVDLLNVPVGLLDLSDVVQIGGDRLLILSQESGKLVEVDANGSVLDELDLSFFSTSAEGVTMNGDGVIYVVAEGHPFYDPAIGGNRSAPALLVLTPSAVPLPPALYLMLGGLALLRSRKHG